MSLCSLGQDIAALATAIPDMGRAALAGDVSITSISTGVLSLTGAVGSILDGVASDVFSLRSQIPGLAALDSHFIALQGQYSSLSTSLNSLQNLIYTLPLDNKVTRMMWDLNSEFFAKTESLRAKATALEAKIGLGGLGGIAGPLGLAQASVTAEYAQVISQLNNLSLSDFKPSNLKLTANKVANQLKGYEANMKAQIANIKTQIDPATIQARVKGGMNAIKGKLSSMKNAVASIGSC